MISKIYTLLFILFFIVAFMYQKNYLDKIAKDFDKQIESENKKLTTANASNVFIEKYKENVLLEKIFFQNFILWNTGSFQVNSGLSYKKFDKDALSFQTEKAMGTLTNQKEEQVSPIKNKIESVYFPKKVFYTFSDNSGSGEKIYLQLDKKRIFSKDDFELNGKEIQLHGTGFSYDMENGDFKIEKNLNGKVTLQKKESIL